jgi:hypothetical protein
VCSITPGLCYLLSDMPSCRTPKEWVEGRDDYTAGEAVQESVSLSGCKDFVLEKKHTSFGVRRQCNCMCYSWIRNGSQRSMLRLDSQSVVLLGRDGTLRTGALWE